MLTLKKLGWLWTVHLNKPVLIHNTTDCNGLYYVHKSPENGFWPIRAFWKWSSEREKAEQCFYSKHCWWLQMKRKEWEVWTVSLLKLRAKFVLQPIFFFHIYKKTTKKAPQTGSIFLCQTYLTTCSICRLMFLTQQKYRRYTIYSTGMKGKVCFEWVSSKTTRCISEPAVTTLC